MSIKIYEAYKIPASKLNEFIDLTREYVFEKIHKNVNEFMMEAKITIPDWVKENEKKLPGFASAWEKVARWDAVRKLLLKTKENPYPIIDIECSLNVWFRRGKIYIIPIGRYASLYDWNEAPEWVEEFCYFNNTDRPEEITTRQWNYRKKVWEEINLAVSGPASHNARRFNHEIVSNDGMALFDFGKRYSGEYYKFVDRLDKLKREQKALDKSQEKK